LPNNSTFDGFLHRKVREEAERLPQSAKVYTIDPYTRFFTPVKNEEEAIESVRATARIPITTGNELEMSVTQYMAGKEIIELVVLYI
jgi:hypothetical protein